MNFFNVTPKPAMLRSIQNERWTIVGALSEIFDNSLGPLRGAAKRIDVFYDAKERHLMVLDDGNGMDAIGRLFQHGNSIGRGIGDIGEYGAGGTKALLWLSSAVTVSTLRDGNIQSDTVVWKNWFTATSFDQLNVNDDWHVASMRNTPPSLLERGHGTVISMRLLSTRRFYLSNVLRDLERIYSTGLRRGKLVFWHSMRNGEITETKTLCDPFASPSSESKSVNFDIVLEHDEKHLPVAGRVYLDDDISQSDSELQIGYGFRTIRSTRDCYRSPDGEQRYAGTGVAGWIDLGEGWQPYLTTTKDAIDDQPLYDTLMAYIFEQIRPLLEEAETKAFDLEFDNLASGLEAALNRRGSIEALVSVMPGDKNVNPSPDPGPNPPDPGPVPDIIVEHPDGKGDKPHDTDSVFRLIIIPQSNHRLNGALCQAELDQDGIMILINKDHDVVKEALKQRPINRMALNIMIVMEMAECIVSLADSHKFIGRLFHNKTALVINHMNDPRDKARVLIRELIDRVRNPIIELAA